MTYFWMQILAYERRYEETVGEDATRVLGEESSSQA